MVKANTSKNTEAQITDIKLKYMYTKSKADGWISVKLTDKNGMKDIISVSDYTQLLITGKKDDRIHFIIKDRGLMIQKVYPFMIKKDLSMNRH